MNVGDPFTPFDKGVLGAVILEVDTSLGDGLDEFKFGFKVTRGRIHITDSDGNSEYVFANGSITLSYGSGGVKTITIQPSAGFKGSPVFMDGTVLADNRAKLTKLKQFGTNRWTKPGNSVAVGAFKNCEAMVVTATDTLYIHGNGKDFFQGAMLVTAIPDIILEGTDIRLNAMFKNSGATSLTVDGNSVSNIAAVTKINEIMQNSDDLATITFTNMPGSMALESINKSFKDVNGGAMITLTGFSTLDVSSVNNGTLCFDGSLFQTAELDLIYDIDSGWPSQSLQSSWNMSFGSTTYTKTQVDSGTTDGTTANKLIQSGQNFLTTVSIGDIILNTTDTTFAEVTAIDSDTQLTLDEDIMVSGETYEVHSSNAAKGRYKMAHTYNITISDGGAV